MSAPITFDYPLMVHQCSSYSKYIKDYRNLSRTDKKILLKNIDEFTKYVYYMQGLPHPTFDQLYMSIYVGQIAYTTDRLMLQAQRGLAKSLTSQILALWLLLRNKEEKIAVLSATASRAESWTTFLLSLMKSLPLTEHLYPKSSQRQSGVKFDINGCKPSDSPSVSAYSITGQKTGMRATFLIYDDVEIPENSDTAGKREKVEKGVREATNLGIANVYRSLCLCTPQSSETIYQDMINRGYKRTIIPAEYPKDVSKYKGDLAPHIQKAVEEDPSLVGLPTDKRHDEKHLAMKRLETTKAEYKLQYMLDTSLSDEEKYPLKLRNLIVMDLDRKQAPISIEYGSDKNLALYDIKHSGFPDDKLFAPRWIDNERRKNYEGICMFIDPSGRGKDKTTYAISAQLAGYIFLLDFGSMLGGYDKDTLVGLCEIAKKFNVQKIVIESNFGDGAFAELLKPKLRKIYRTRENGDGVKVEDNRATKNKQKRIIDTLEPTMEQHRLIVNKASIIRDYDENTVEYRFTYQLSHITSVADSLKHDDVVDVVEMAVVHWKQSLARDEDTEKERYEDERLQEELDAFAEEFGMGSKSGHNIMDYF